ncbi:MAG: tetratricopeptide repeat protein, partial [Bacillota bacterium]
MERKPNYSEEVTYLLELGIAETLLVRIGMASLETAEARFHAVLEMDPGNIEALNLLAQICAQSRRHSKAREFLARALEGAEEDRDLIAELVGALADIYEKAGKYRLAVRTYQVGLGRTESAALHNGIAYCYAKLGHYRKAVSHSRRAVELEPDNAVYMSDLGYTLLEAGNLDEA